MRFVEAASGQADELAVPANCSPSGPSPIVVTAMVRLGCWFSQTIWVMASSTSRPPADAPESRVNPAAIVDPRALFGALPTGTNLDGPIAAVGTNTGGSGTHAYVIGFGLAAKVLLRAVTRQSTGRDLDDFVSEDALVHPIAYCARHFVELFLKDVPRELHGLRRMKFKAEEHHDIGQLWGSFESACTLDRRTREFPAKLRDAVIAIAALDPTGQTFRYRNDTVNKIHLEDVAVIYLPQFERSYVRMLETVEDLYAQIEGLQLEYILGTYTENLSRSDLMDIAERIGVADKGGKQALQAAQKSICTDYSLSRRQYELARAEIDKHYKLSSLAGREKALKELTAEVLGVVVFAVFVKDVESLLSEQDIAAIWGVLCAAEVMGGSEDYEPQVECFLARTIPTRRDDVLRALRSRPTRLRRGLQRLGQGTLLQALDSLVSSEELQQLEQLYAHERWPRHQ